MREPLAGALVELVDYRVEARVALLDALDRSLEELLARDLLFGDELGQSGSVQGVVFGKAHGGYSLTPGVAGVAGSASTQLRGEAPLTSRVPAETLGTRVPLRRPAAVLMRLAP